MRARRVVTILGSVALSIGGMLAFAGSGIAAPAAPVSETFLVVPSTVAGVDAHCRTAAYAPSGTTRKFAVRAEFSCDAPVDRFRLGVGVEFDEESWLGYPANYVELQDFTGGVTSGQVVGYVEPNAPVGLNFSAYTRANGFVMGPDGAPISSTPQTTSGWVYFPNN